LDGAAPVGWLVDLLEHRWRAAGQLSRWRTIAADLDRLHQWLPRDEEESWGRLLLTALDYLTWGDESAADAALRCRQALEQLVHLQTRLADGLDRLDFLHELAAGWRRLQREQLSWPALVRSVPISWMLPFGEFRPHLIRLLRDVSERPRQTLELFGDVRLEAPAVLAHFGGLLDALQSERAVPADGPGLDEGLKALIVDFLDEAYNPDYPEFRVDLLDFCLREMIEPETVAAVAEQQPVYWVRTGGYLAEAIRADRALRHVCRAHRLFWA
jgi:hypothetical protein